MCHRCRFNWLKLNWIGGTFDVDLCSISYVFYFFETYAVEQYSLSHVPFYFYIFEMGIRGVFISLLNLLSYATKKTLEGHHLLKSLLWTLIY